MKKNDEGFTLIELLIVIVILGILATVVVFAVGGITNRGKESACDADRSTLEVAIEAYNAQEGVYPTDEAVLSPSFMRSVSEKYELSGTSGDIQSISGSGCASIS